MNPVEAIRPATTDSYSRYYSDQSPPGGMNPPMGQLTQMARMAQEMITVGALLGMLSQLVSPPKGGGNQRAAGFQQPSDPFMQFLKNLFNPPQQEGGGSDGPDSADGGHGRDSGGYGNGHGERGGAQGLGSGTGNQDRGRSGGGLEAGGHHASHPDNLAGKNRPRTQPVQQPDPGSGPSGAGATTQIIPSTRIPQPNGAEIVNEPIVVKAGQTFDGGGKLFKAGLALGDGGQSESQKPVFVLEPGATLQNVQVQGADGVHLYGDAHLKNVWWRDVGEDACTLKKPGNVTVEGGGAFNASDKVFQINAPGSISINGFYAQNFDKLVRQNGGTDFPLTVRLSNISTQNAGEALVRTDSPQAKIYLSNVDPGTVQHDVLAPNGAVVEGAVRSGYKPYTG